MDVLRLSSLSQKIFYGYKAFCRIGPEPTINYWLNGGVIPNSPLPGPPPVKFNCTEICCTDLDNKLSPVK